MVKIARLIGNYVKVQVDGRTVARAHAVRIGDAIEWHMIADTTTGAHTVTTEDVAVQVLSMLALSLGLANGQDLGVEVSA